MTTNHRRHFTNYGYKRKKLRDREKQKRMETEITAPQIVIRQYVPDEPMDPELMNEGACEHEMEKTWKRK